jgi:hypothetical protein
MKTGRVVLFLLTVMAFVGYACREAGGAGGGRIISIDQFDKDVSFKFSSVVDSISYVVLETNDESLLGNVTKMVHRNHAFFIGNAYESNAVLVFSEAGKFLRKLYSVGQGPGEYLTIDDFCVSNDGVTLPIFPAFSVPVDSESVRVGDEVYVLLFSTLEDVVEFCNQAGNQADAAVRSILEQFMHAKVEDV